ATDFGDHWERLDGLLDLIGEFIEFPVTVLVARHRRETLSRLARVADHRHRPRVEVELGGLKPLVYEPLGRCAHPGLMLRDRAVNPDEPRALERPRIVKQVLFFQILNEKVAVLAKHLHAVPNPRDLPSSCRNGLWQTND